MRKTIKLLPMLLLAGLLFSCETEVTKFDSVKEAKETIQQEEKEAKKEEAKKEEEVIKEKDIFERQKNPDTLTMENSNELKDILSKSIETSATAEFFNNNKYNIVEFDAHIESIDLIPGKKTRYSILLYAGDDGSSNGPLFMVTDVGPADQSVRDLFKAAKGEAGNPVKVKARIYGYIDTNDVIELKLESLTSR